MRARDYSILVRAVEEGVAHGVRRAYKYAETVPSAEALTEHLEREVLNAICDVFDFEEVRDAAEG